MRSQGNRLGIVCPGPLTTHGRKITTKEHWILKNCVARMPDAKWTHEGRDPLDGRCLHAAVPITASPDRMLDRALLRRRHVGKDEKEGVVEVHTTRRFLQMVGCAMKHMRCGPLARLTCGQLLMEMAETERPAVITCA